MFRSSITKYQCMSLHLKVPAPCSQLFDGLLRLRRVWVPCRPHLKAAYLVGCAAYFSSKFNQIHQKRYNKYTYTNYYTKKIYSKVYETYIQKYPYISKISQIHKKYQAAAGPARPDRAAHGPDRDRAASGLAGPGRAGRAGLGILSWISCIFWIYLDVFVYIFGIYFGFIFCIFFGVFFGVFVVYIVCMQLYMRLNRF